MTDWDDIASLWRRRAQSRGAIAKRAGVSVRTLRIIAKAAGWDGGGVSTFAAESAVAATRALYSDLRAELLDAMERLRAPADADGASRATARIDGLIKDHQKALFALIDAEDRLAKGDRPDGATTDAGASVLDLAAARAEIDRRLARLAAAEPVGEPAPEL